MTSLLNFLFLEDIFHSKSLRAQSETNLVELRATNFFLLEVSDFKDI